MPHDAAAVRDGTTNAPLRILHLEDDPHDRELAAAALAGDGIVCEIRRVDSRETFEAALIAETFDIILADYALPTFDGLTAQAIARRLCPDTPFIFLSGSLGEELAIDRLKDGATDYVLKQRMARLPSAVRRARLEAAEHGQRQRAQDEVRRLNAELERRVDERTGELRRVNDALARREAELQESDQRLQGILEYSPAAIYMKDLDGRYLLVNRRIEQLFGRGRDELLGKTDHEVLAPRLADIYRANDQRVISEQRAMHFEEAALVGGVIRVLASSKFPLFDPNGNIYAVCGISEDVTERKRADDEVKLARLEAVRANSAKNEFLSHMSHDLRTPLNAVLGFAQLLDAADLHPDHQEAVRQIINGGRLLLDLINEVLDIARIEAGRLSLSPEPVVVEDVIQRAVDLVRPLAAQRGVTLDVRPLPVHDQAVLADRQRLTQILLNLLSNAVKYNRPEGMVTVSVESTLPARLRIMVADTGSGVPPEKLKLLFHPFERLGAEHTGIEGTGLGLALSRALAEAMGGTLGVESVVDRGSTFWVELGIASTSVDLPLEPVPESRIGTKPARSGTIVYVEDNLSNVRLVQRILRQRPGVELRHAPDGRTGLSAVQERRPDLVLLDLHLPDISGEDVLRGIWSDPETRKVPTIVMTADATPGLTRRLKAAGAAACVTKPLDIKQVLQLIDAFLNGQEGDRG